MKKVLLLHGFMGDKNSYFLPFLKKELSFCEVVLESFPDSKNPDIDIWTKYFESLNKNDFDLVIAHSLGGTFALSMIQRDILKTKNLIMIGSSVGPKDMISMNTFLKYPIHFPSIKERVKKIITVQSFDDPWTYPEYGILNVKHSGGYGFFYGDKGHFEIEQLPDEILREIRFLLTV